MTYQKTLDWMFAQLPMYQQAGKIAFNEKLNGIKLLSAHLGFPEKKFKSIHIAGTNGKGSSSHLLASILQEAGYRVGLYTSPHLKDFRERIRINGEPVSMEFVVEFISNNKLFFENHKLSFFEMTVGMAFEFFFKKNVDIAIVEVGLGGRWDSTNIITPEVSLITNIGYDHMDMLGDTLIKIAYEKAGIIKENVPVVVSEYQEEIANAFVSIAEENKAKIIFADQQIEEEFETSLLGDYQIKNTKGVLAVIKELANFKVDTNHIKNGLLNVVENTGLMGRWQVLQKTPKVICDSAHNVAGLSLVLDQLQKQTYRELHIIIGLVKDKDLSSILPLFPKNAQYYFCKPKIPRGLSAVSLKDYALEHGLKGGVYASVNEALTVAKKTADSEDLIFIGGSTFVVAEVL